MPQPPSRTQQYAKRLKRLKVGYSFYLTLGEGTLQNRALLNQAAHQLGYQLMVRKRTNGVWVHRLR